MLGQVGKVWTHLEKFELIKKRLDMFEPIKTNLNHSLNQFGQDPFNLDKFGKFEPIKTSLLENYIHTIMCVSFFKFFAL